MIPGGLPGRPSYRPIQRRYRSDDIDVYKPYRGIIFAAVLRTAWRNNEFWLNNTP